MWIDPKTCNLYKSKFDIMGIPAPDYLVEFLNKHTSSGVNKYNRIKRGSKEQFTDKESVALAITFGRDKIEFRAHLDRAADPKDEEHRVTVELDEPVQVEVINGVLTITRGNDEIPVPDGIITQ